MIINGSNGFHSRRTKLRLGVKLPISLTLIVEIIGDDKMVYDENEIENIPDDQQEDENDLGIIKSYKDSNIMNTDWTVETIYKQMEKGNIDLQPEFQRRFAWDNVRKSRLIESIIVGMPVPNIVIAENKSHRGRFIVIDGKQRLLSIKNFIEDNLELQGLDIREDLNGKTMSRLSDDDKEYFENSTIRSSLIRNWKDDSFLYSIFFRLNSGSLPLSPQELRKALVGGKLINEIEEYLINSAAMKNVFGDKLDRRMRDSELVIRFISFDNNYENYNGNLKSFLDNTTYYYEDQIAKGHNDLKTKFQRLDLAISTTFEIFKEDSFKKWVDYRYEKRINRAVFDCLTRFFCEEEISILSIKESSNIIEAYKNICLNPEFRNAIELTTKSISSTRNRIDIWGNELATTIGKVYNHTTGRIN